MYKKREEQDTNKKGTLNQISETKTHAGREIEREKEREKERQKAVSSHQEEK